MDNIFYMTTIPASIRERLEKPFQLTSDQIQFYQKNRFIKLKQVFDEETISFFNDVISKQVTLMHHDNTPLEQRSTYGKAFLQLFNLWREDDAVKTFIFSERLAKIATDLMQVDGVRIYHDQALFKEGGGGITPWHADQYYWPLETDKTVTAWIPLQATPLELGPLEFSAGSHQIVEGRDLEIGDESEEREVEGSGGGGRGRCAAAGELSSPPLHPNPPWAPWGSGGGRGVAAPA
jgi:ectoine hydroxylase-related dioxygenase (phytanoyl-CoA dioxygenase family)